MKKDLQLAFDRLMTDGNFMANFRHSPEQTLQGYTLGSEEIAALKSGDERILADLGVDLVKYLQNPSDLSWFRTALARSAPGIAATLIVLSLALALTLGVKAGARSSNRSGGRTGKRAQPRVAPDSAGRAQPRIAPVSPDTASPTNANILPVDLQDQKLYK